MKLYFSITFNSKEIGTNIDVMPQMFIVVVVVVVIVVVTIIFIISICGFITQVHFIYYVI